MLTSWLVPVIFALLKMSSLIQCCTVRGSRNAYLSVYHVKLGRHYVLNADFKVDGQQYTWRKDGKPLAVNCDREKESDCTERIYTYKDNPSLVFQTIASEDSGKYILETLSLPPSRRVFSFKLIVEVKPSVYTDCEDMIVHEGDTISCACQADNLNATVSWDPKIPKPTAPGINKFTDILVLENVSENENGTYTCFAEYRGEINSTSFNLNVLPKNPATMFTKTKIKYFKAFQATGRNRSQLFILVCKAEGIPQPQYTILYEEKAVSYANTYSVGSSKNYRQGNYECFARNSNSFDRRDLFLNASLFHESSTTGQVDNAEEKKNNELTWEITLIVGICSFVAGVLILSFLFLLRKKINNNEKNSGCAEHSPNRSKPPSNDSRLRHASTNPGNEEIRDSKQYELPSWGGGRENVSDNESSYQELSGIRETDEERYQSLNAIQP